MATEDDSDVPETGAIFTFGKSKFGDNSPCKFWLKNDQVSHVCCGDEHTALVTENGRTFMFGSNVWGQLGLGHTNTVTKPTRIKDKAIKDEKVKLIGCGRHHTVLATESGKLFSFGGNSDGQLGLGAEGSQPVTKPQYIESLSVRNFKMLSCGAEHSVALTEDGKLYVWGGGSEGQLGLAQTTEMAEPTLLPFDESIVYVACGYYHTAFVTESGKLYTFGEMDCGKLGQGDEPPDHQVAQVVHGIGGRVVAVACGGSHTVALTESGSVYTFGDGSNGQLGHGTTILVADTPQELSWGKNVKVKFASCGENSTSLITDKGQLYTFGDGRHGKLALGEENFANQFTPSLVLRFENFTVQKVSCGGCHMLAIAKIRTENGVKDDWEDSEGEDDMDASPSNNLETTLRKSADFSGGSLDLSGSIAARNRRREKLPDPMGTLNRTLPPLNSSLRGLPPLGQTQAPLDDTLSKKTLPQIHKLEEPESKSAKPVAREEQHKAAERKKKEDTEEEESSDVSVTEESSEEEEEKKPALIHKTTRETNKSVPLPKPRAMPRKSKEEEDKEEESSVESEDEGDDDEESEDNEEEERAERKKHLKQEEEKKEEAEKTKVKPKPALRKSKEQEKKSEDSDEEEETEEEEEDSEEDVSNKKLSKKQAVDEAKRKKQADKKEKEKPKKKPKPISVFGRRRVTQSEDDHNNDSSDDDDDEEEEEEEQKKSKGAKDKKDKKKTKKEKNKKSDEDSEDEEEEDDEEEDQKEAKKSKNKDKNKKGKKKTKENDSEEDEDGSEDEEADNKNEKKSESSKGVEDKQSKACTIL